MSSVWAELKRRNVVRVAIAYVVTAWLTLQVADVILNNIEAPDWVFQAILLVLAIGFPLALIFAWAFELTPEGIRKEKDVDRCQSITAQTGRRLDFVIIGVLVLALLVLGIERVFFAGMPESGSVAAGTTEKSIAVLPFADLSQDRDQEWFADGLAEEIINALTKTPDLLVTARTSAFSYKNSSKDVPTIAAELGVAHILEGSVRRVAERFRITAQLIRAADGFHLWSQNYDRDAADVIGIQEDLALQIASALETTMDPEALQDMVRVGTRSVDAYLEYIHGIEARARSGTDVGPELFRVSYEHFERARSVDPGFSAAHRAAAFFWERQLSPSRVDSGLTDLDPLQVLQNFQSRIDLAIATAPNDLDRQVTRAEKALIELRLRTAVHLYREYLAARPNDLFAWITLADAAEFASDMETVNMALNHVRGLGETNETAATYYVTLGGRYLEPNLPGNFGLEALERWPDNRSLLYQTHRTLLWATRIEEAAELASRYENRGRPFDIMVAARQSCAEGRRDEVLSILAKHRAAGPVRNNVEWLLLYLLGDEQGALRAARQFESPETAYPLATFLVYPYFDPSPFPALMAALKREGVQRASPRKIPFACPAKG